MKILLTGAGGQLGCSVKEHFPKKWGLIPLTSQEFDISSPEQTKNIFNKYNPDIIINAAAYTAVDLAEEKQETAENVNVTGVKNLAEYCKTNNTLLIHISTDYVFDGIKKEAYLENDETNPINVYGYTKEKGEQAIFASGAKYIILRTSWVFSEYGNNFVKTMMRLGQDRDCLNIINDQIGCPTYAGDIALAINTIIKNYITQKNFSNQLLHYCGNQATNWADFARFIFDAAYKNKKINHKIVVNDIETKDYPAAAQRPKNSMLNCEKIKILYDIDASNWKNAIIKLLQHNKI